MASLIDRVMGAERLRENPSPNTRAEASMPLVRRLSTDGVEVNVTAVFTLEHVCAIAERLSAETPAFISVFAGRVADTGVDPLPIIREALAIMRIADYHCDAGCAKEARI